MTPPTQDVVDSLKLGDGRLAARLATSQVFVELGQLPYIPPLKAMPKQMLASKNLHDNNKGNLET